MLVTWYHSNDDDEMLSGTLPGFDDGEILIVSSAADFPCTLMGFGEPGSPAILVGEPDSGSVSGDMNSWGNPHRFFGVARISTLEASRAGGFLSACSSDRNSKCESTHMQH
jgi:hypothetical protein